MAGTGLRNGPANGTRTWTSMKMFENQLIAARSHPILADRPEDRSLPLVIFPCMAPALTTIPAATAAPTILTASSPPRDSAYWLKDAASRGMKHICWDGCMFSNEVLETPSTWQHILEAMIRVDKAL